MNLSGHQVRHCVVNKPVLLQSGQALESGGVNAYAEVTAAIPGPGMPGMQVAFVDDLNFKWIKGGDQSLANGLDPWGGHGRT